MTRKALRSVPWRKLHHAYGPAGDLPAILRALSHSDPEKRRWAINALYGNIFHQGTRYEAAPHAIPFLLQLAGDPNIQDRANILVLLAHLALGYPDDLYLPSGVDPEALRQSLRAQEQAMSASEREECQKYHSGPLVDLACYDAVKSGLPALLPLIQDADEGIRCASAYLFAWFPELAPLSRPALLAVVANARSVREQAHALIAIGLLGAERLEDIQVDTIASQLEESESLLLRTAAAIALYRHRTGDSAQDALLQALTDARSLTSRSDEIWFNEGNLAGQVALTLSDAPERMHEQLVPALCTALETVNPYQSLHITRALLDLVIGDSARRRGYFRQRPVSGLTTRQRAALEGIGQHGGWRLEEGQFVNYAELVRYYGLPGTQEEFQAHLRR